MESTEKINIFSIVPLILKIHVLTTALLFSLVTVADNSVGTIDGTFRVSETGAAVYTIPFEISSSGTNFDPQIGLVYNSQQPGYGNAGYGFSISGLSCITRSGKDRFHDDNETDKVKYEAGDNYLLDGKRLYLKSGLQGVDGSTYTVEGNPYVTVTLHGDDIRSNSFMWFELQDTDGNIYQYSRILRCFFGHPIKSYQNVAWYITLAKNKYNDQISYLYREDGNVIYPTTITYGRVGERHTISFEYAPLYTQQPFVMEGGTTGTITQRLSTVTSRCQSNIYRQYTFSYSAYSDNSTKKYDRLTSINIENAYGERLEPITFDWNYLDMANVSRSNISVNTQCSHSGRTDEGNSYFVSFDMNNDGIADIIRGWQGEVYDYYLNSGIFRKHSESFIYISRSTVDSNGTISFSNPTCHSIPPNIDFGKIFGNEYKSTSGGLTPCNLDGDALSDIILPYYNTSGGNKSCLFCILRGNHIASGNTTTYLTLGGSLSSTADDIPLYYPFDINNDGKDEIFFVEQKMNGGTYHGKIIADFDFDVATVTPIDIAFTYSLSKDIKKIFLSDCNADGLQDIVLIFDGGYKIYFNNGGTDMSNVFTESNTREHTSSSTLKYYWRMEQGDFNGDGLVDFVVNTKGDSNLGFLFNNGDGTFTASTKTNIDFADIVETTKDDDYFAIRIADFDKDGLSDLMVSKMHMYNPSSWYESDYYRQDKTQVRWFRSDGTKPVLWLSFDKSAEERDCYEANIFTGDLNGDGFLEIANYGSPLNSSTNNIFNENTINIYSFPTSISLGHLSSITNGLGKTVDITYSSGTNPTVYTKGDTTLDAFPVNTYTIPLTLVANVSQTRGVVGSENINYSYEGLKVHQQGRGLLGFSATHADNTTLMRQTTTRIEEWNQVKWIPESMSVITTVGSVSSTTTATTAIVSDNSWNGNYFTYCEESITNDFDNNITRNTYQYDLEKGVPTEECIYYDGETDMYKKKEYRTYNSYCGKFLPSTIVSTQKNNTDTNIYTLTDTFVYNAKGDIISTVTTSEYNNDIVTLQTQYTRDVYGNVLSEHKTGNHVDAVTKYNVYNNNMLRPIRTYTTPASSIITYSYDNYGNVTAKNDVSNSSNILTTTYTYDNWGRLTTTTYPDGTYAATLMSWDNSNTNGVYKTTKTSSGNAPETIYYDSDGHELCTSTTGVNDILISSASHYNSAGEKTHVQKQIGQMSLFESYSYDNRGRVVFARDYDGSSTFYSYGNRSVTKTAPTGTTMKICDAWGNAISVSDNENTTSFIYNSP